MFWCYFVGACFHSNQFLLRSRLFKNVLKSVLILGLDKSYKKNQSIIMSLYVFYNLIWIIVSFVGPPGANSPGLWFIYVIRPTVHQVLRSGSLSGSAVLCFTTTCPCVQICAATLAPAHTHVFSLPTTANMQQRRPFTFSSLHIQAPTESRMCIPHWSLITKDILHSTQYCIKL